MEENSKSCDKQSKKCKKDPNGPQWDHDPGVAILASLFSISLTISWLLASQSGHWFREVMRMGHISRKTGLGLRKPTQVFFCLALWVWIFLPNPTCCYISPKAEYCLSAALVLRQLHHLTCPSWTTPRSWGSGGPGASGSPRVDVDAFWSAHLSILPWTSSSFFLLLFITPFSPVIGASTSSLCSISKPLLSQCELELQHSYIVW